MSDVVKEGGLRSDGELVQGADAFVFVAKASPAGTADHDHKDWIPILSTGGGGVHAEAPILDLPALDLGADVFLWPADDGLAWF